MKGQAVFKHWFVDFEFPNENGKPHIFSGGEMVDPELGAVPDGWEVISIGDVVKIVGGGTPRTNNPAFLEGGIHRWTRVNLETIKGRACETTFQEICKKNFRPIKIAVPTPEILTRFEKTVGRLFKQIVANEWESRALTSIRDAFLLKLMSGEIRVNHKNGGYTNEILG
ncbi:MAG: hypothetical protein EF813_08595 [Methanosarcinales archaeon]|nr:MAG: hypothetical protein EF813_08595 [Methanosarcinales archaeon]